MCINNCVCVCMYECVREREYINACLSAWVCISAWACEILWEKACNSEHVEIWICIQPNDQACGSMRECEQVCISLCVCVLKCEWVHKQHICAWASILVLSNCASGHVCIYVWMWACNVRVSIILRTTLMMIWSVFETILFSSNDDNEFK